MPSAFFAGRAYRKPSDYASKGASDIALEVRYKACPAEVVQRQMEELCPEVSPLRRESLSRRIGLSDVVLTAQCSTTTLTAARVGKVEVTAYIRSI